MLRKKELKGMNGWLQNPYERITVALMIVPIIPLAIQMVNWLIEFVRGKTRDSGGEDNEKKQEGRNSQGN